MSSTRQLLSRKTTLAHRRRDHPFHLLDRLFRDLPIHRAQRTTIRAQDQHSQLLPTSQRADPDRRLREVDRVVLRHRLRDLLRSGAVPASLYETKQRRHAGGYQHEELDYAARNDDHPLGDRPICRLDVSGSGLVDCDGGGDAVHHCSRSGR